MKILKFQADWCQPCKMLTNILNNIKTDVEIEVIDIDQNPEMAKKYNIRGVPTLVKLNGETVVSQSVGLKSKEQLEQWING